jgi:hypothetical protein
MGSGFEHGMAEIEVWMVVAILSIQWEIYQLPRNIITHIGSHFKK